MKLKHSILCASMALAIPAAAFAMGGASGPHTNYIMQGHLGEVMMNPYEIAPLTAVIRDNGYDLSDVTVRIVPKTNGQEIKYTVSRAQLLTRLRPLSGLSQPR